MVWIDRVIEASWLLTIAAVPLIALGQTQGEWSSVIGSYELPKIVLLRTMVALMASLVLIKWGLGARFSFGDKAANAGPPSAGRLEKLRALASAAPTNWLILAVVAYLGSVILSTVLSAAPAVSWWGDVPGQDSNGAYTIIASVLLFGVVATHLRTPAQVWRLIGAIITTGVLVAGYAIAQRYGFDFLNMLEGPPGTTRVSATFGNPVFAASLMLMTVLTTLATGVIGTSEALKTRSSWWRLSPWVVLVSIQLIGLTFTLSRGAWAATGFGAAVFLVAVALFVGWRPLVRGVLTLALAVAVAAATVSWAAPPGDIDSTQDSPAADVSVAGAASQRLFLVGAEASSGGLSGRIDIWQNSWNIIIGNPSVDIDDLDLGAVRRFIGYGPDLFRTTYLLESPPTGHSFLPQEAAHAHNYFIHQAVELGLIGFLASLSIFGAVFVIGARELFSGKGRYSQAYLLLISGLVAVFAARFVEQLFGIGRVSDLTMFWVLLALVAASPLVMRRLGPGAEATAGRAKTASLSTAVGTAAAWWGRIKAGVVIVFVAGLAILTWDKSIDYFRAGLLADDAATHFRSGNLVASESSLNQAIELAPDVSSYRNQKNVLYRSVLSDSSLQGPAGCGLREDPEFESCVAGKYYSNSLDWVERRPLQYRSRLELAEAAKKLGLVAADPALLDQATQQYLRAVKLIPSSQELWKGVATVFLELSRPEEALMPIERVLAILGENALSYEAYLLRSAAYRDLGRLDEAVAAVDDAIRVRPEYAVSYFERGVLYQSSGDLTRAMADFNESVRLGETFPDAFFARGSAFYGTGEYLLAIEDLNEAVRLDPNHASAFNNRGLAYARLGFLEAAVQDFTQAIILDREFALAFNNRGFTYRDLGQLANAMDDLTVAIGLDPDLAMARYNRAITFALLDRNEEAQADASKAIELGIAPAAVLGAIQAVQGDR